MRKIDANLIEVFEKMFCNKNDIKKWQIFLYEDELFPCFVSLIINIKNLK